jgi:hypothetical protein
MSIINATRTWIKKIMVIKNQEKYQTLLLCQIGKKNLNNFTAHLIKIVYNLSAKRNGMKYLTLMIQNGQKIST